MTSLLYPYEPWQLATKEYVDKTFTGKGKTLEIGSELYNKIYANNLGWIAQPYKSGDWRTVCWSPELKLFLAVAPAGSQNRSMLSSDGRNWAYGTIAEDNWYNVCWSKKLGIFCTVGTDNAATSPDGITWTYSPTRSLTRKVWTSVCWSARLDLFVAVAGGTEILTSPDGINWTSRTTQDNSWSSICVNDKSGLFVAVASGTAVNRIMYSADGVTWTCIASPALNQWNSICYSPEK
jgi:hypothetical protein